MSYSYKTISALPIVVPVGLLVLLAITAWLLRRKALSVGRGLTAAAISLLVAGIVANSAFPIYLGRGGASIPWHYFINLVPGHSTEIRDDLLNVLIFIPVGVLIPLATRFFTMLRVTVVGSALSLLIECAQFVGSVTGHSGHVLDINDWLCNSAGGFLGRLLLGLLLLWTPTHHMLTSLAFPGSGVARHLLNEFHSCPVTD